MDILERGLAAKNFAMLGLGDIVIPGNSSFRFVLGRFSFHTHGIAISFGFAKTIKINIKKPAMYVCDGRINIFLSSIILSL